PAQLVIVGSTGSVSAGVAANLATSYPAATIIRLGGANRYATGAAISGWAYPGGASRVFLASGLAFPDALAGAVAAGLAGAPVLLTSSDTVPAATLDEVRRLAPTSLVVLGSTGSVSNGVVRLIDTP
ncbi:MAG: cell wall-binding repeat-containing protein, partial [Candidatus Limnocylindrales bacterium]